MNSSPSIKDEPTYAAKHSIDQLFHQALDHKQSAQYRQFFTFIAKFNHYSRYNSMLVYLQNPAVTFFGTASYWRTKFKRKIKRDPKPLLILAPNGPIILAYDLYDTIGNKSPEAFLEAGIGQSLFEVRGEFKESYLSDFKAFASEFGIIIMELPLNYFNAGAVTTWISGKLEIHLREGHEPAQHFATLCHELGHILLGHTGHVELKSNKRGKTIRLAKRPLGQKQQELEAETVSFLVCKSIGIETSSLVYLAGYLSDEQDWNEFSYELVIKVADRLQGFIK